MKKITPRDIISSISRDLDIGYRGKYRYLLDKNEMAGRHSQRFIESIRKKIDSESLTSYPDQTKYYNKLSSFLSVPSDNLLLFPGSDSALKAIFESFVSPEDIVFMPKPTYAMAEYYAALYESKVHHIEYSTCKDLNLEHLNMPIDSGVKMIYMPNPGQPYGNFISKNKLIKTISIAEKNNVLVVIDEAYFGFNDSSMASMIHNFDNLIIMRTLSKVFGLAGARIGYLLLPKYIKNILFKVKTLHDISFFSLAVLESSIDNFQDVKTYVEMVKKSVSYIKKELSPIGLECYYNNTNFVYINIPNKYDINRLDLYLKSSGILVRVNYENEDNVQSIRISLPETKVLKKIVIIIKNFIHE